MSDRIDFVANGSTIKPVKAKKVPKAKAAPKASSSWVKTIRMVATIGMGITLPLLVLWLCFMGGHAKTIYEQVLAYGLVACVLGVSLPHLAWSYHDLTKSSTRGSWLMAVSTDLAIVLAEMKLTHGGSDLEISMAVIGMFYIGLLSMFLNCWAFIQHKNN